jgi:DNA-binding transcriptional LysR family regulator
MDAGLEMEETRKMPDWDGLRIFLALCRARTLAAAARKLGIDETTVARRLARLEKGMGAALLERAPGGLALTAAGEGARAAAEEMEGAALAAERRVLGADRRLSGTVRVTAPEILGNHFVLPALQAVHARHPGIAIELISTIARLDVTRREADVAVRTVRPTEPSLVARKLGRMAVAPYVRRGRKRSAKLAVVSYADGIKLPLRNLEDRAPGGRVALRTNSIATVLAAVRLGWGAGDLPCFVGDASPELERAFPGETPDWLDVWLIVHADVQRTSRVRALVHELTRIFREGADLLAGREKAYGKSRYTLNPALPVPAVR